MFMRRQLQKLRQPRAHAPAPPRLALLLLAALLTSGCVAVHTDIALAPPEAVVVERDITYGAGERSRLDIYRQPAPPGARRPLIIYFHPGAFYIGNKAELPNQVFATALARRGAVVVVPNYSLWPEGRFPRFLEDGAEAVAWARRNAERLGADPDALILSGHSAGAYIGVMLAMDSRFLAAQGVPATSVAGAVGLAGMYVFGFDNPLLMQGVFAGHPEPERQRPAHFARPGAPPLLLMAGGLDPVGAQFQTLLMAERVRGKGGEAETQIYLPLGHMDLLSSLPGMPSLAPVPDDVMEFVRRRIAARGTLLANQAAR